MTQERGRTRPRDADGGDRGWTHRMGESRLLPVHLEAGHRVGADRDEIVGAD
jgi:hypothetical protein